MIGHHAIAGHDFARLAAGGGGRCAVAALLAGQRSRRLLLLLAAADRLGDTAAGAGPALTLLRQVQRDRPDVVAEVLGLPGVGGWAADCLAPSGPSAAVGGYLAGLAAAAALRAGADFEIEVPAHRGLVHLPGLGTAAAGASGRRPALVRGDAGVGVILAGRRRIQVPTDPHADVPGWRALHRLRACAGEQALTVTLDDADPYRAPPGLAVARTLTGGDVLAWEALLGSAWRLLVRHHPEHAEGIAAGLRALVPLAWRAGTINSATVPRSFGAILLVRPTDGESLALTLLHEFQHGKLAALHDLVPLHGPGGRCRYFAPWRDDPRPAGALLQGAYAHLAVADYWRTRWRTGRRGDAGPEAVNFAYWRAAAHAATAQLASAPELSPAGRRLVAGMAAALGRWQAERPPGPARRAADRYALSDLLAWRIGHLRPDPADIGRLAAAWPGTAAAPASPLPGPTVRVRLRPGDRGLPGSARHALAAAALRNGSPAGSRRGPGASDLACARDRYAEALAGYRAELAAGPAGSGTWSALIVALREVVGRDPASAAGLAQLTSRPELVCALYQAVRDRNGTAADPLALAAWLAVQHVTEIPDKFAPEYVITMGRMVAGTDAGNGPLR